MPISHDIKTYDVGYDDGYRKGFEWAKNHCETNHVEWLNSKNDRELYDLGYFRIPKDATGVPIRFGDAVERLVDKSKRYARSIKYSILVGTGGKTIIAHVGTGKSMTDVYTDYFSLPEHLCHDYRTPAELIREWVACARNDEHMDLRVLEQIADELDKTDE